LLETKWAVGQPLGCLALDRDGKPEHRLRVVLAKGPKGDPYFEIDAVGIAVVLKYPPTCIAGVAQFASGPALKRNALVPTV